MTGLELELRVDQFNRNAKSATDALKEVGTQAVNTQTTVSTAASKVTNAFAVGTSGISAASAIASTASSVRSLNSEMAVLSGSRALLELGRLGSELGTISTRGGLVGRVLGGVATIAARTGPWIALAGAVVSVGSAFFGMSKNADTATKAIEKQSKALQELIARSAGLNIAAGYGQGDPRTTVGGIAGALGTLRTSKEYVVGGSDAAGLFGLSEAEFRRTASYLGVEGAERRRKIQFVDPLTRETSLVDGSTYDRSSFGTGEVVSVGEYLLRQRRSQLPSQYAGSDGFGDGSLLRTDGGQVGYTDPSLRSFRSGVTINVEQQATVDRENKRQLEQQQRALEAARELKATTDAIGATLGDAAADFAQGLATGRQIMLGLIADAARLGFRAGFQGLAGSVGGLFGTSGTQGAPETFVNQG